MPTRMVHSIATRSLGGLLAVRSVILAVAASVILACAGGDPGTEAPVSDVADAADAAPDADAVDEPRDTTAADEPDTPEVDASESDAGDSGTGDDTVDAVDTRDAADGSDTIGTDADAADGSDTIGTDADAADGSDTTDTADATDAVEDVPPPGPREIFGSLYWDVYRPAFLASYYQSGRVTDRRELGTAMFGDTNMFMAKALSTFLFEYRAAGLEESLAYMHEILDAYVVLDAMPANPGLGYFFADPLDGYVYRSDRGPDYETNFFTHNNEPSGDQYMHTLAALRDVVDHPGALVHGGVDLKALARAIARRLGEYLVRVDYVMKNPAGEVVARGPDQRLPSWAFAQGAANVTGSARSAFETTWTVLGIPIPIASQHDITRTWIRGTYQFTDSCVGGTSIDVGLGLSIPVSCNEFNIGLGWASAVMSLSPDPGSPDWFSAVVPKDLVIAEGHTMTAMYARYRFGDDDPDLLPTIALFLTAPASPPTGVNLDPNGWCRSWRWAHDFDDPDRCLTSPAPGAEFSGLDYMLPRAMASAFHEFPPAR